MAQRQHAQGAESGETNPAPETSYAERARTMLSLARVGVLATQSDKLAGFPFGSTMPYALDAAGRPLFLISALAMHTKNLKADPRASLFVTGPDAQADPLGAGRLTLLGTAEPLPADGLPAARAAYLARQEAARYYADFSDFSFWRLNPVGLYFVGGFGVMGWVEIPDFTAAAPDPLAEAAVGILAHMNKDHEAALRDIARHLKDVEASEAKMTAVDRLGFHLRLKTAERVRSVRVGFPSEVRTPEACRAALVALAKAARRNPAQDAAPE